MSTTTASPTSTPPTTRKTLTERWNNLTPATKKKIKILILCLAGITIITLAYNPVRNKYTELAGKRENEKAYEKLLRDKEEESRKLKDSIKKMESDIKSADEKFHKLAKDFSEIPQIIQTNIVIVQKTNYVNVAKDNNSPLGPDKAEDIFPGLKDQIPVSGMEDIEIEKGVVPGNGTRFYIPKGWSIRYKYYCKTEDFDVFVNKGTMEIPIWIPIGVQDNRVSESLWIKNKTEKGLIFRFILFTVR